MTLAVVLDELIGIGGLVAFAGAAFYAARFRATLDTTRAAAEAWQKERDAEVQHRKRVETQLVHATAQIKTLEGRIEELSRRPDITVLERLMAEHEQTAERRSEQIVVALGAITDRLGELVVQGRATQTAVEFLGRHAFRTEGGTT
jgi:TolA-binding protein